MYAVVCSKATNEQWGKAVECLRAKHNAVWGDKVDVIQYNHDVKEALPELQRLRPSYSCFVAVHSECSEQFVRNIHSLTREIDVSNP